LTTNHQLIAEGREKNHCVGTYSQAVDSGRSGIFKYGDYTLEISFAFPYGKIGKACAELFGNTRILMITQFKGFGNSEVPLCHRYTVENYIKEFNSKSLVDYEKESDIARSIKFELAFGGDNNDLPF
jgi:hypothetical protein